MTSYYVSAGPAVSGIILNTGDYEELQAGGVASGTIVNSGGWADVQAGGLSIGAILSGGNFFSGPETTMQVYGSASATTVDSGCYDVVQAGGIATGTIINNGGEEEVATGGTTVNAVVNSGGDEFVYSGGVVSGLDVKNGGQVFLWLISALVGPSIGGITLESGAREILTVVAGGSTSGLILTGTSEDLGPGAAAVDSIVNSGSDLYVSSGSVASGTILNNGGSETVLLTGVVNDTIVSSGGNEFVEPGGTANRTIINSGGNEFVYSGGIANDTVVNGGYVYVYAGGSANGSTVVNDGTLFLSGTTDTVSFGSNLGTLVVAQTGSLIGSLDNFSNENVLSFTGRSVTSAIVSGLTLTVTFTTGALINFSLTGTKPDDGPLIISPDGANVYVEQPKVISSNGSFWVYSGGVVSGSTISTGRTLYVYSGGTDDGSTLSNIGREQIFSGGVASGTIVKSGGDQFVSSGGSAYSTVVSSGGFEIVSSGGVVSGADVLSGGQISAVLSSTWAGDATDGFTVENGGLSFVDIETGNVNQPLALDGVARSATGIIIGNQAPSSVIVEDGATVATTGSLTTPGQTGITVGNAANGVGFLTVTGAGTTINDSSYIIVGEGGTGTLVIENGAKVGVASVDLGWYLGIPSSLSLLPGSANVTITGAGTSLIDSNTFRVGAIGSTAVVAISDGASVSALNISVGSAALYNGVNYAGTGAVTVSHASLTGSGNLDLGLGGGTGILTIDTGGIVTVSGTATIASGSTLDLEGGSLTAGTLVNHGTITGYGTLDPNFENDGVIEVTGGPLVITDPVTGTGSFQIDANAALELQGGTAENVAFAGANATLTLDDAVDFTGTISGLQGGDTITLAGISATSATLAGSTLVVDLTGGGTLDIAVGPDITDPAQINLETTDIVDGAETIAVICFMPGTSIAVLGGAARVEMLRIGDIVLTHDGDAVPILWIGRQTVATRFADPLRVLPIRIKAGALGDHLPERDLCVSPDHALLIGDILVQAAALVNGVSIFRDHDVPAVFTYYHIELADHALVLAEGVGAESFVDNADRMGFDNWAEHLALFPDGRTIAEMPYPRAKSYRQIPAALRDRLSLPAREARRRAIA